MNGTKKSGWIKDLRIDEQLLRLDPLLVRIHDRQGVELAPFLADLIAWNAGLRDYASAAQDYLQTHSFSLAAQCVQELDTAKPANAKLLEDLRRAWDNWRSSMQSTVKQGRGAASKQQVAECAPEILNDLEETTATLERHLQDSQLTADTTEEDWLKCLGALDEGQLDELRADVELLELAIDVAESTLAEQAEQQDRELEAVRNQAAKLFGEIFMRTDGAQGEIIDQALKLRKDILAHIERKELADSRNGLKQLADLGGATLDQQASVPVPAGNRPSEARNYDLSSLAQAELREPSDGPMPEKYPTELDDPPAWEWNSQALQDSQLIAQLYAASGDHRYAKRALGPFLAIRGKQHLIEGDPERALIYFRDAYGWAATPPKTLRTAARWRQDCAWVLLLCVALSAADGPERRAVLTPTNLAALFQREIGDLPLALLGQRNLLPDLSNVLLALTPRSIEVFFEEHLWNYLLENPVALHDLIRGFADDLLERPHRVLEVYALILRAFGDSEEKRASDELSKQASGLQGRPVNSSELRQALDAAQRALHKPAGHSDLAEAVRQGLASRSRDTTAPVNPRVSVALIPGEDGYSARHRLILGVSYTKGTEILRGVQLEARLHDNDDRVLEGGLESPVRIGRLIPEDRVEIALAYRAQEHAGVAKTIVTKVLRRAVNGALSEVEHLGKRLTLASPKPETVSSRPNNPYVVGRALHSLESFFGRDEQIDAIARGLIGQHQDNVVLVLGERRIGKTTVLLHLQQLERIKTRYIVAYRDMESAGDFDDTATFYREYLIRPIRGHLQKAGFTPVPQSSQASLSGSAHAAFERFMSEVDELLANADQRLLVILDEFEKVLEKDERPRQVQDVQLPEEVLASIRSVLLASRRISFVLAGVTDVVRRHIQHPDNRLFNLVIEVELKHLDHRAAKSLICDPAKAAYTVTSSAQEMLIAETNCHPYLIQQVCRALFEYMIGAGNLVATTEDVRTVLEEKILPNAQPFSYLLETLRRKPSYLPVIDTLAHLQSGLRFVSVDDLTNRLERKGLENYGEDELLQDLETLAQQIPSLLARASNDTRRYHIAIGLFARHRRLLQQAEHSLIVSTK